MVTEDSVVVVVPDQVSCDLQGELLILNVSSGFYYGLDSVGKRIWSLLQQPAQVSSIRDTIVKEYDVDRERCTADLNALLMKLAEKGLVEVKPAQTV